MFENMKIIWKRFMKKFDIIEVVENNESKKARRMERYNFVVGAIEIKSSPFLGK